MKYRALSALAISISLVGVHAHAQDDDEDLAASPGGKPSESKKADEPPADAGKDAAKQEDAAKAKAEPRAEVSPADTSVSTAAEPASQRPPVYGKRGDWNITPYGYARLDAIEDSTQSFEDGIQPNLIARVGTYKGDHRRTIFTARDSRLGIAVGAPTFEGIKSSAVVELDFYGLTPTDARKHDSVVFGPVRIRHAYFKLETSVVDVIAGQYYDLFGWNGSFYPATVGYLGVPAQVYHRNPQLRIEKKIHLGDTEITAAVAAVRPGQRDSGVPDGEAGIKFAFNGWNGAAMAGFGRPSLSALSIGVSGLYRRFEAPAFRNQPGSLAVRTNGWGVAAQALLPVIPIKDIEHHGNALTLTGEFSTGTGIADMYTFMDGGSRFPLLPNPQKADPAFQYQANVDPGLVTFDRNSVLKTINWRAVVAGAQYYLPVGNGRIWLSGTYSRVWSDNLRDLTPFVSWGAIFTKMDYIDANLGFDITPAAVAGLSFQTVHQQFGDVTSPDPVYGTMADTSGNGKVGSIPTVPGTGGKFAGARNNRVQLSMALFF